MLLADHINFSLTNQLRKQSTKVPKNQVTYHLWNYLFLIWKGWRLTGHLNALILEQFCVRQKRGNKARSSVILWRQCDCSIATFLLANFRLISPRNHWSSDERQSRILEPMKFVAAKSFFPVKSLLGYIVFGYFKRYFLMDWSLWVTGVSSIMTNSADHHNAQH